MSLKTNVTAAASKHSNFLFAAGEIGLVICGTYFTVKNTEKYIEKRKDIELNTGAEKAKFALQMYWPTMVCMGGFIGLRTLDCIYSDSVRKSYAKALMASQAALMAKQSVPDIKKKLSKEVQGKLSGMTGKVTNPPDDKPETNLEDERATNAFDQYEYVFFFKGDEMPDPEESVFNSPNMCGTRQLFYIPMTGRLFVSTFEDVKRAEAECAAQIDSGNRLYLNEMNKYLGIGSDNIGAESFIEGDTNMDDPFSLDLAPGAIQYEDGFGSMELIWTINPNKYVYSVFDGHRVVY